MPRKKNTLQLTAQRARQIAALASNADKLERDTRHEDKSAARLMLLHAASVAEDVHIRILQHLEARD